MKVYAFTAILAAIALGAVDAKSTTAPPTTAPPTPKPTTPAPTTKPPTKEIKLDYDIMPTWDDLAPKKTTKKLRLKRAFKYWDALKARDKTAIESLYTAKSDIQAVDKALDTYFDGAKTCLKKKRETVKQERPAIEKDLDDTKVCIQTSYAVPTFTILASQDLPSEFFAPVHPDYSEDDKEDEADDDDTPAPTTKAPTPTTQAPVPATQAPVPTTQAPAPTTQAPVPTEENRNVYLTNPEPVEPERLTNGYFDVPETTQPRQEFQPHVDEQPVDTGNFYNPSSTEAAVEKPQETEGEPLDTGNFYNPSSTEAAVEKPQETEGEPLDTGNFYSPTATETAEPIQELEPHVVGGDIVSPTHDEESTTSPSSSEVVITEPQETEGEPLDTGNFYNPSSTEATVEQPQETEGEPLDTGNFFNPSSPETIEPQIVGGDIVSPTHGEEPTENPSNTEVVITEPQETEGEPLDTGNFHIPSVPETTEAVQELEPQTVGGDIVSPNTDVEPQEEVIGGDTYLRPDLWPFTPVSPDVPPLWALDEDYSQSIDKTEWKKYVERLRSIALKISSTGRDQTAVHLLERIVNFHYNTLAQCIERKLTEDNLEIVESYGYDAFTDAVENGCNVKFRYSIFAGSPPFEWIAKDKDAVAATEIYAWFNEKVELARADVDEKHSIVLTAEDKEILNRLLGCTRSILEAAGNLPITHDAFYAGLRQIEQCAEK